MYLLIQEEYNNIPKEIQVESKFHFFISFLTIKMSYEKKRIASSSFWLLYLKEFWERLSCAFNTFPNFSIICTSSWTSYRCHSLGAPAIVQEEQFAIIYDKLNTWGRWHFEQNWHCTDCSSVQRQIMGSECHSMILLHFSSN